MDMPERRPAPAQAEDLRRLQLQQGMLRTLEGLQRGLGDFRLELERRALPALEGLALELLPRMTAQRGGEERHVVYVARRPEDVPRIFLSMSSLMRHADGWRGHFYHLHVTGVLDDPEAVSRRCLDFGSSWQLAEAYLMQAQPAAAADGAAAAEQVWSGLPLQELLALPCERVLVLEAETLVCGDLSGLFELELGSRWGAAVKGTRPAPAGVPGPHGGQQAADGAPPAEPGMLLLDLAALRRSASAACGAALPQSGLRFVHSCFNCRRERVPPQDAGASCGTLLWSGAQAGYPARPAEDMPPGPLTPGARRRCTELLLAPGADFDSEVHALLGHEVIVSLTSFALRAPYIAPAVTSLLEQSFRRCRVVLWLAEEEFTPGTIPAELQELVCERFEIRFCPDMGSYKKLLPALQAFPEALIITADDDILYHRHWLAELLLSWLDEPDAIHCHMPRLCLIDSDRGQPQSYLRWPLVQVNRRSTYTTVIRGCTGVLYPPHALPPGVCDYAAARQLCPGADDLWFWAQAVLHGTRIRRVRDSTYAEPCDLTLYQNRRLWTVNLRDNDRHLQRLW